MFTIYKYNGATREYTGPAEWESSIAGIVLPANATPIAPPAARSGYAVVLNMAGDTWEYVEDHRNLSGYINGVAATIVELGPLPTGWSTVAPEPTPEQTKEIRRNEIVTTLQTIDLQSVRPLRAKVAGTATADDERILAELEAQAVTLRAELATLV